MQIRGDYNAPANIMKRYFLALLFCGAIAMSMAQAGFVAEATNNSEIIDGEDQMGSLEQDSIAMDSVVVMPRNLSTFREMLTSQPDSLMMSSVEVVEDPSAVSALESLQEKREGQENLLDGYRVGVYFDNSASARARALWVVDQCKLKIPYIIPTMSYSNPYFKVSVGYCVTLEEAVIMLNKVQKHFPKAYLMRERFSPEQIAKAHQYEEDVRSGKLLIDEIEAEEKAEQEENAKK